MMSFSWRPQQSCYSGPTGEPVTCPGQEAAWWFWLMGLAVVAGVSARKRRGGGGS